LAEYTADEIMTVAASRQLADGDVCLVGIGLPSLAANLARRLHAPTCVLIYESGTIGAKPRVPPLSIGDGELADTADTVVSVPEIFNYWLQAGRVDVGFLGAAQIDRHGNLNTTVIGPYASPSVRLPGAGGAPEIASSARRVVVVLRHSRRAFVERVDFRTTVPGRGPTVVITDLGVLERRPAASAAKGDAAELVLASVHPGVTVDQASAATGWELRVADEVRETVAPTTAELAALRDLQAGMEA
jgi:glutaconate CoA-transferase subunit B